jgi:Zn-dependent protease with chaperone function
VILRGATGIPVWLFAAGLVVIGVVLTAPVSSSLARARWTRRTPRSSLVLWQAVCLAAGFSVVAGLVLLTVEPMGNALLPAVWNFFAALFAGGLQLPLWRLLAGLVAASMTAALLTVVARTAILTVRRRRAHRQVLDLLTMTRRGMLGNTAGRALEVRILQHRSAVAYTLPGWHSRIVLSAGLIDLLTGAELAAVVEHERAHLRARHDLLVLPFQAWAIAFGRIPGVRPAGASVTELTEMMADDVAAARTSTAALAAALAKVALAGSPAGAPEVPLDSPAITGTFVADRVQRLLDPRPLTGWQTVAVLVASVMLLAIPASVLLLQWT